MDMALWFGLVGFILAMSYTPGPNNLMVMSSSALFGFKRTLPHWFGVNVGFNLLLVAAVFGLGELVARYPVSLTVVKIGGAVWLAWMSWKFASAAINPLPAAQRAEGKTRTRPFRTWEAALFQIVNPKALMMTISAAGAYVALADTAPERGLDHGRHLRGLRLTGRAGLDAGRRHDEAFHERSALGPHPQCRDRRDHCRDDPDDPGGLVGGFDPFHQPVQPHIAFTADGRGGQHDVRRQRMRRGLAIGADDAGLREADHQAGVRQGEMFHRAEGRGHVARGLAIDRAEAVILDHGGCRDGIGIGIAVDQDMDLALETRVRARLGHRDVVGDGVADPDALIKRGQTG